jgi:hypothetical protein
MILISRIVVVHRGPMSDNNLTYFTEGVGPRSDNNLSYFTEGLMSQV